MFEFMENNKKRDVIKSLGMITQLGLNMFVPIFCCIYGAGWLQRQYNLGVWIVVLGVVLGVGTGFSNLATTLKKFTKK